MRDCWLLCNFRLACRGQGLHAPMPTFASLTRSGPLRKNELLHLLWCAKVRTCNSIHWTTRAPLISVWNYFTAAGYAFCQEEKKNKKKNLYECKTTWKWGRAFNLWEHVSNCTDTKQTQSCKNKNKNLLPNSIYFEWTQLSFHACFFDIFLFICVWLQHSGPCIASLQLSCRYQNNNSNQRRLQWSGYTTLVCHSRLTLQPCRQGEIRISFSYLHMK